VITGLAFFLVVPLQGAQIQALDFPPQKKAAVIAAQHIRAAANKLDRDGKGEIALWPPKATSYQVNSYK
jgi:hypothetical protein